MAQHRHIELIRQWSAEPEKYRVEIKTAAGNWEHVPNDKVLWLSGEEYRLVEVPEVKWYRVVLMRMEDDKARPLVVPGTPAAEDAFASSPSFVRWLTDRVEYTVEEEPAKKATRVKEAGEYWLSADETEMIYKGQEYVAKYEGTCMNCEAAQVCDSKMPDNCYPAARYDGKDVIWIKV